MPNKYSPQKCPRCGSSKFKELVTNDEIRIKCYRCGFLNIRKKSFLKKGIKLENRMLKSLSIFLLISTFFFIGVSLNFIAMRSNDGKMPVRGFIAGDFEHFPFSEPSQVQLFILTDIFQFRQYYFSLGDFLIYFCSSLSIIYLMFEIKELSLYLTCNNKFEGYNGARRSN